MIVEKIQKIYTEPRNIFDLLQASNFMKEFQLFTYFLRLIFEKNHSAPLSEKIWLLEGFNLPESPHWVPYHHQELNCCL